MTRHWRIAVAVFLVTAALVGGLVVVVGAQSVDPPVTQPAVSVSPATATAVPRPGPITPPSTPPAGPPPGTAHLDDRYLARYDGHRRGWDDLIDAGRKLPKASDGCRARWKQTTKDGALDWDQAGYLCLDRLTGKRFRPQGIGGSGSTRGYRIGGRAAADRNLVLVSSYSGAKEAGLRFPNEPGRTVATRLTAIDLDRSRYNQVELVRPLPDGSLTALDSHGSGLAWAGHYLYSSSRGSLWMYNADDLMEIDGRYVLPAVARWSVTGSGGLSSIGVDRSKGTTELVGINYSQTGTAWSQTFELDRTGRLRQGSTDARNELSLISVFGPGPATVQSTRSAIVPGTNFQGIGTSGPYRLVNSSSLMLDGRRHGDNLVIIRKGRMITRFAMPSENLESLYVDYRRDRYVTVTEHGRQFLFWLPLDHLIDRAER